MLHFCYQVFSQAKVETERPQKLSKLFLILSHTLQIQVSLMIWVGFTHALWPHTGQRAEVSVEKGVKNQIIVYECIKSTTAVVVFFCKKAFNFCHLWNIVYR